MTSFNQDDTFNEFDARYLLRDGWRDWTPTIDQNGAVTHTVSYAKYLVLARLVIVMMKVVITGTGSAGSAISATGLPFSGQDFGSRVVVGSGAVLDLGTGGYSAVMEMNTATTLRWLRDSGVVGASPSFALGSGDICSFQIQYERT